MWCVWSRMGPYEPESGVCRETGPNRDNIGTGSGQEKRSRGRAFAHPGLAGGARGTATGPEPVDFGRCLGACRTWSSDHVTLRRASRCDPASLVTIGQTMTDPTDLAPMQRGAALRRLA